VLLDEIEKAHPEVFNMLLQIFDDGHLTDAKGRKVDFRNTILIMTSNVGSDLIRRETAIGFSTKTEEAKTTEQRYAKMREKVLNELKNTFRPEFLNRVDSTVVFHALSRGHIRQIVDLMLHDVDIQLSFKGISLEITDAARDWLGDKGYDETFGARPLRRLIQNEVEDRLSEALLEGKFGPGDKVVIDCDDGGLNLKGVSQPALT
jgi:ATP-dependent Clp protease ATP-binding subunit ClpC